MNYFRAIFRSNAYGAVSVIVEQKPLATHAKVIKAHAADYVCRDSLLGSSVNMFSTKSLMQLIFTYNNPAKKSKYQEMLKLISFKKIDTAKCNLLVKQHPGQEWNEATPYSMDALGSSDAYKYSQQLANMLQVEVRCSIQNGNTKEFKPLESRTVIA